MIIVVTTHAGKEFPINLNNPEDFELDAVDALYLKREDGDAYALVPPEGVSYIMFYKPDAFRRTNQFWMTISGEEYVKFMSGE